MKAIAFSPDGRRLASIADDGIRVWALDLDELLYLGRRELTRWFTEEECGRYLGSSECPEASPLGAFATRES